MEFLAAFRTGLASIAEPTSPADATGQVNLFVRRGGSGAIVKQKPVIESWPAFDAPLLREMAAEFLRRRKAIAYQAGLSFEREFSESAAGSRAAPAAVELRLRYCGSPTIRLLT